MDSGKTFHRRLHDVVLYIVIMLVCCAMLAYCPRYALADDEDTGAGEVWQQYTDESFTSFGLRQRVTKDLGWRWFNAEDQSKIPLVPTNYNMYKTLPQYLEEYGSASAAYDAFARDVDSDFIFSRFALVTYENEYDTWGVGDSWSEQHYKEWYDALNGIVEDGGNSGGDGNNEDWGNLGLTMSFNPYFGVYKFESSYIPVTDRNATIQFTQSDYNNLIRTGNNKTYMMAVVYITMQYGNTANQAQYYFSNSPIVVTKTLTNTNDNQQIFTVSVSSESAITNVSPSLSWASWPPNANNYVDFKSNGNYNGTLTMTNVLGMWMLGYGGGGSNPEIPPVTYPPEIVPSTPTQPTAPTDPTYTGNTYNIVNNVTNQTTGTTTDLTPILEAIRIVNNNLDELEQNIIDALDNMWNNMRGYFDGWFTDFSNWFDIISTQLQQWGEQLDSDLQTVNMWLRRIFEKLRGGAAADRPDITIKEDDFWDWLDVLFQKILNALPDSISDFITELNRLTGRFPFSVPWDLAFMLGLLSHQPVTPVFSFYLPSVDQTGLVVRGAPVTVDMSDFDDVAALARRCELILFAVGLAKMTVSTIRDVDWTMYG